MGTLLLIGLIVLLLLVAGGGSRYTYRRYYYRRPMAADEVVEEAPDAGSPLGTGDVQPGASLQTSIRFVIPRDQAHIWLEYRDSATRSGLRFALGTAQQATADEKASHSH